MNRSAMNYISLLLISCINFIEGVTYNTKYKNGNVLAAHRADGTLITWGDASYGAEGIRSGVSFVASTYGAFAAVLSSDGSVVCWGDTTFGADCSGIGSLDIQVIHSVNRMSSPVGGSFAALDGAGTVFNWGDASSGGYNADVASLLTADVLSLEQCGEGFLAVKPNEVIVPWSGGDSLSGDPEEWSVVDKELATGAIERVYGNGDAFCVLKEDTTVFCWGDTAAYLGTGPPGALTAVIDLFTTDFAFAALTSTGAVVAWGDSANGGDASGATLTDVAFVASTATAFAAQLTDGTVEVWGDVTNGGMLGVALADIIAIFSSEVGFAAVDSTGAVFGWGTDATPPGGMDPIVDIATSSNAFAALSDTGNVYRWGLAAQIATTLATDIILASGTVTSIYATDSAFAAIYGPDSNVVCWGVIGSGGDCTGDVAELYNIVYIYGNEIRRTPTFQTPTLSPTVLPTSAPSTQQPTQSPRRPTLSPSQSLNPTKSPQVWPFVTKLPTGMPSGEPSASVDPIVAGNAGNLTYYCRPKNYVSGSNAFQRIEAKLELNEAASIVNASVWIDPYEETDELSLRGSYGGTSHGIYATYSNGRLELSRVEGHTGPVQWAAILQNVAYKFSDYLKPCSRYRKSYFRHFRFQVIDVAGRSSNIYAKGLTIETASVVYSNTNTIQISQEQDLDVNGNSARWIGPPARR